MKLLILFSFLIPAITFAEDSKPSIVFLKAGSILINLKDKSEVQVSKGMYANVLEESGYKKNYYLVCDKNGLPLYETLVTNINTLKNDIDILPKADVQKIFPQKSLFKTDNLEAKLNTQINVSFEQFPTGNLSEIVPNVPASVTSARYELRTIYLTNLLFDAGLNLSYQSAYWNGQNEFLKMSILSLGPYFRYSFLNKNEFVLNGLIGAEMAPIYQGFTQASTDKYSAVILDFGLESEAKTYYGIFTFGVHLRHHDLSLSSTDRADLALVPREYTLNTLGLMIGYKIEWSL